MRDALKYVLACVLTTLLCLTVIPTAEAASFAKPSSVKKVSVSNQAVGITWKAAANAPAYRIQYSTSSKMKKPKYKYTTANSIEIPGLKTNTTYYFRVRVVSSDHKTSLSSYSSKLKIKTSKKSGFAILAPTGLQITTSTSNAISLSWIPRAKAARYRVMYSTSSSFTNPGYLVSTDTTATITGLKANKRYYFKIRVIKATSSENLSPYSPAINGTTPAVKVTPPPVIPAEPNPTPTPTKFGATPTPTPTSTPKPTPTPTSKELSVVSYNVSCANCFQGKENENEWDVRRDKVVSTLLNTQPDVIGFQEAGQGKLYVGTKKIDLAQFEDLINRLGSPYKLTNTNRYNCVNSTTDSSCKYLYQGASKGTKIAYNSATVSLVNQGSKLLSRAKTTDPERYVAWGIFKQLSTGKLFFFADTHLEDTKDSGSSSTYFDLRKTQTTEALTEIALKNPTGLPVFFVGDFNSHKATVPANGPYDIVIANDLIDPLGNYYKSTNKADPDILTSKQRVNTNYSSYNGWARHAPVKTNLNGTYIDYIFITPNIKVKRWETVVDVDKNGDFIGIIPSDHNLLTISATLP